MAKYNSIFIEKTMENLLMQFVFQIETKRIIQQIYKCVT